MNSILSVTEKLENSYTYHIFNRGINGTDLFLCQKDYEYFLHLYAKFIHPVADSYAWVLLKNHFHFFLRIKDKEDIPYLRSFSSEFRSEVDMNITLTDPDLSGCEAADRVKTKSETNLTLTGLSTLSGQNENRKKPNPSRQFSHLFNAYARYFNTRTGRHGGLFETPFKRIKVNNEKYFRNLVYYIHQNPVKHGFVDHILDWGWSSYLTMISVKPTKLCRETVLGYFDNAANFKVYHHKQHDLREIEYMLLE